jgi:Flp pilus assembly protein TadG
MHVRRPADERGAQSLELSLVIPLVLAVAMLVAAAGQVVLALASTHHLAGVAARVASLGHDDDVHELLAATPVTDVDIAPATGSRHPGDLVTVRITRQLSLLVGGTVPLSASVTLRTEDVP